jgi:hypothetical protein
VLSLDTSVATSQKTVNSVLSISNRLVLPKLGPAQRAASFAGVDHDGSLVRGSDNVIASTVGVVVPLESELIAGVGADGLGGLGASDVALNVLGGDIEDGVVVGRRIDVSSGLVADTLVLAVDEDVPNGGVGRSSASKGEGENSGLHF